MMREEFLTPEIEVVKFSETEAILTASITPPSGGGAGRDPIELPEL